MAIQTLENATPRCDATVRLISRHFRPYLFEVTVMGQPPHAHRRVYKIAAPSDDSAAHKGLELFVKEFSAPVVQILTGTNVPKAKLQ